MSSKSFREQDDADRRESGVPEKHMQNEPMSLGIKKRGKERVQFDFSKEALDRVDYLKDHFDINTRAEVVRLSLRLLDWFATETEGEDTITVTNKEGKILTMFKAKLLYGYGNRE